MRWRLNRCRNALLLLAVGVSCCRRSGNDAGPPPSAVDEGIGASPRTSEQRPRAPSNAADATRAAVGSNVPEAEVFMDEPRTKTPGLEALIRSVRRKKTSYRAPNLTERNAFRSWVEQLARRSDDGSQSSTLPPGPAGFVVTELSGRRLEQRAPVWVIHEGPRAERGAGIVVLRQGWARPVVVQAPHTFFDTHTLDIALSAFEALEARALLVNTVHRAGRPGAKVSEDAPSKEDVAHSAASYFSAAHEGLAIGLDGPLALQLHGFRDEQAPGVQVIVSAAGTIARLDELLSGFRGLLPAESVRHYPSQIRLLGGTTNVQARWSVAHGYPFIHIELSRSLRAALAADEKLRWRFAKSLGSQAEQEPP